MPLSLTLSLRLELRPGKMTATLNGRMANVVGYFVPLHSLTTLVTHMYIFECCLHPTSGCESVWNRIRTYGAAKPHGRLTACCLKPLGHPNVFAKIYKISDNSKFSKNFFCGAEENRTLPETLQGSLASLGTCHPICTAGTEGFEPTTFGLTVRCSNR